MTGELRMQYEILLNSYNDCEKGDPTKKLFEHILNGFILAVKCIDSDEAHQIVSDFSNLEN